MEMREALEAAFAEEEKGDDAQNTEVASEAAPAAEPAEPAGEAKVELAAEPDKPKQEPNPAGKKVEEPSPAKPETVQDAQGKQHRVDRAPASWTKEAKGEWATVPLHIRQEVHRREIEINRALAEANNAKQQAGQYDQIASPYAARLQSLGATPQQAFQHLLNADYQLASGTPAQKAQFIDKLLQDYGVDITELDRVIAARLGGSQPAPQQPDIQQLVQQQLQQALAPIYQQQQQQQLAQQQEVTRTVEQMSLDPKFPFFDDVREDMADIMELSTKRGVAITLEQAYNKAIQLNPEVSSQMSRQQTLDQANQQHLQAQKAKRAGSSVTGSPAGGGSQEFSGDGSLRGSIEAAFANARI